MTGRLLTACAFLFAYSGVSSASVLFTAPGSGALRTGDGFSLGAIFTYNGSFASWITDLGIEDVTAETWDHSHEIGLWDLTASNTQIADATVDNTGTLIGGFRYVHLILPVPLTAGHQYKLAAYYFPTVSSSDHLLDHGAPNPTADPLFGSFTAVFTSSNTVGQLSEPNGNAGDVAYVGPNFIFLTPEPATFALTGLALLFIPIASRQIRLKR